MLARKFVASKSEIGITGIFRNIADECYRRIVVGREHENRPYNKVWGPLAGRLLNPGEIKQEGLLNLPAAAASVPKGPR